MSLEAPATSYQVVASVLSRTVGDETVLIDLESETYFGLNKVGAMIWIGLEGDSPPSDIVRNIVRRYDVPLEQASRHVEAMLDELRRAGLVLRRVDTCPERR